MTILVGKRITREKKSNTVVTDFSREEEEEDHERKDWKQSEVVQVS